MLNSLICAYNEGRESVDVISEIEKNIETTQNEFIRYIVNNNLFKSISSVKPEPER